MSEADTPLRILMISDFYPPIIGGMERHVQTQARELARRGHHVAVATLWQDGEPAFELDEGVSVHRLKGWNRALLPWYESRQRPFHPTVPDPGVMAGLRRLVREHGPDLVHARGWMLYSFLPLKTWSKAALVVTLHDYGLVCAKKTYIYENHPCSGPAFGKCVRCATATYGTVKAAALTSGLRLSSSMHGRVDRYVAISSAVAQASFSGTAGTRVEVISSFVPDEIADPAYADGRPEFLPATDEYILFVGALESHKGLDILLRAYRELNRSIPLLLLGAERPSTPTELPSGAVMVRDVPHRQVMAAWEHSTVGVVPSVWPEPFGQVAVEAMMAGRSLVASAVGGLQDVVIDGETGILVPPRDADSLRRALETLLDDPTLRLRMGEAARARARLFTASVVTTRVEQLYRDVLEETGHRAHARPRRSRESTLDAASRKAVP